MHIPALTYSVTRDYPYRWYTPAIVLVIVIATVLFSFLNFVSSGYTLQAQYLSSPDAAWTSSTWLSNWPPSLVGDNKVSCQSTPLAVGASVKTTHGVFEWQNSRVVLHLDNGTRGAAALIYKAGQLQDCGLHSIDLKMTTDDWGQRAVDGTVGTSVQLIGRVWCSVVDDDHGKALVNLSAIWRGAIWGVFEATLEEDDYPSRWWSRTLLYFSGFLVQDWWQQTYPDAFSTDAPFTTTLFYSEQAFDGHFSIQEDASFISNASAVAVGRRFDSSSEDLHSVARSWAELFTSAMWTDLGQSQQPNIFGDFERLRSYAPNISSVLDKGKDAGLSSSSDWHKQFAEIQRIFPNHDSLRTLMESSSAQLNIEPAIFETNYLCQVPVRKPWGNLITSILVADLVFLRALWSLLGFAAAHFAKRKTATGNVCEACVQRTGNANEIYGGDRVRGDYSALPLDFIQSGKRTSNERPT